MKVSLGGSLGDREQEGVRAVLSHRPPPFVIYRCGGTQTSRDQSYLPLHDLSFNWMFHRNGVFILVNNFYRPQEKVMFSEACSQSSCSQEKGAAWCHFLSGTMSGTSTVGQCSSGYASYWNAFLLIYYAGAWMGSKGFCAHFSGQRFGEYSRSHFSTHVKWTCSFPITKTTTHSQLVRLSGIFWCALFYFSSGKIICIQTAYKSNCCFNMEGLDKAVNVHRLLHHNVLYKRAMDAKQPQ